MSKIMMASGLEFQELRWGIFNGDDPLTSYFPDQRQAALEFTQTKDSPGQYFQYNKYHPQLLGLIIFRNGLEYGISGDEWIKSFYRFASDL